MTANRPHSFVTKCKVGFLALLAAATGCAAPPPEDGTGLVPSLDSRVDGSWRLEVDADGGTWPLGVSACVRIETRSVASWQITCADESLLGSFPAVSEPSGAIRLDAVLAVAAGTSQVRLLVRPLGEEALAGTIALVGLDGALTQQAPVTLTRR